MYIFFTIITKSTDLIGTVNFSAGLKNLHNVLRQFKGNMAFYLHYIVVKPISAISNKKIVYSCIKSNHLWGCWKTWNSNYKRSKSSGDE